MSDASKQTVEGMDGPVGEWDPAGGWGRESAVSQDTVPPACANAVSPSIGSNA
ncbi:hypothetical protein ACWEO2_00085 [Nocardia sp. NPDC004278]